MPPPLPDELVEEVLLRFPPENPAWLVRAGLVCTRRCRLVSGPGFRRRFREFHRRPPMLGTLYNLPCINMARFVPTTAFPCPRADREDWCVLDACHGRVLVCGEGGVYAVWDPITDEVREVPFPPRPLAGHRGPFLVVFVCSKDAAAWGNPVCAQQHGYEVDFMAAPSLVGNTLYFGNESGNTALKYDLESRQMSWIPYMSPRGY